MKKILPLILFSAAFIIVPVIGMATKKDKNLLEQIVEKIELTYQEIREKAPFVKARGKEVAKTIRFIQPEDQAIADYSKLKQIALIRHGEPDMNKEGKYTPAEANQYLKCYDSVCIIVPEKPFFLVSDKEDVKVFSSPINRALTTAQYIFGTDKELTVDPVFREFENKISSTNGKKKSMRFWKVTSRLKWMLGGGKKQGIESFSNAKKRAKQAAEILDNASINNQKVLLTAHGLLNRYVKKNLKKMGWRIVEDTGNDYFGTTILVKIED